MKLLVSTLVLATVLTACLALEQPAAAAAAASQASSKAAAAVAQQNQHQQQSATGERQGRSISASGNASNSLSSNANANTIEHSSKKSHLEQERRAVTEFMTPKNIFKSIIKLLFGNQQDVGATSRNVLGVLSQALDLLKSSFGQKSRSSTTARTIRDSAEEAASASVSLLQGYIKSVLAKDEVCQKRYLCEASREAVRDARDLGYMIATVGGYATSYLLDSTRTNGFNTFYDASVKGRQLTKDECLKYYECEEQINKT